jgi:hypothetical protein
MTEIISEFSCRLVLDCELLPGIQRILVYACYCYGKVIMSATAADSFIHVDFSAGPKYRALVCTGNGVLLEDLESIIC